MILSFQLEKLEWEYTLVARFGVWTGSNHGAGDDRRRRDGPCRLLVPRSVWQKRQAKYETTICKTVNGFDDPRAVAAERGIPTIRANPK